MKKSIIALALVLAIGAAGPVSASGIEYSGSLETTLRIWHQDSDGNIETKPS